MVEAVGTRFERDVLTRLGAGGAISGGVWGPDELDTGESEGFDVGWKARRVSCVVDALRFSDFFRLCEETAAPGFQSSDCSSACTSTPSTLLSTGIKPVAEGWLTFVQEDSLEKRVLIS